jgi:hypothetical protein
LTGMATRESAPQCRRPCRSILYTL